MRKLQKGGQNKPKIYTDRKQFEQAQRMYYDSLYAYENIPNIFYDKMGDSFDPKNPNRKERVPTNLEKVGFSYKGIAPTNMIDYANGPAPYSYKKPVQPVVYQPQEQSVEIQQNQPYKKPITSIPQRTHPIQKMTRLNPERMDLTSKVNIQGQQVPFPQFQIPQQKGTPVYGPGNTIVGYSDNMNFKPAYQYTGAPNNQLNLQDKVLLDNPEELKKYLSKKDNYKFSNQKFQNGGVKPKVYTDRKQFEQAQRMYNDSLGAYNMTQGTINDIKKTGKSWTGRHIIGNPTIISNNDYIKIMGYNNYSDVMVGKMQNNTMHPMNIIKFPENGTADYLGNYKKPVQPVVYQPQETITSPQTVSSQHGKKGMWGAEYDKKHPPIYVTNPKDPRIGQYGKDGNQYLYKGPTHPIQKMSRINPQQMDLNSNVNIQGQPLPFPQFQLPQQKGTPVYGPGNTIIGYSDNMNFKPAYQYTGAPNNTLNLQDKALLENPEALRKYVLSRDNYKFPIQEFKDGGGKMNPPKVYTDRKQFEQAQRMYNDSLNLYNNNLNYKNKYLDFVNKAGFDKTKVVEWTTNGYVNTEQHPKIAAINNGVLTNSGGGMDRDSKGNPIYFNYFPLKNGKDLKVYDNTPVGLILNKRYSNYKKPVQPVKYQFPIGQTPIVSGGASLALPKIITKPKPTHPIQKMSRINPQQMDLNSQVNIQGQPVPFPQFQLPQQKGTPVYGPGNTIIGYSNNMQFQPAWNYTGAANNAMNLQDKALLNDHEALRKYISSRDNYRFHMGGQKTFDEYLRQQNKPITDKNNFSKVPYTQQQSQSLINQRNTEKRLAQEKLNQEIAARNTKNRGDKFQLPSGQNKYYSQMSPKEKFYIDGLSLQNKGRWNEDEVEQPFLNSLNPIKWIYDMAGNLGKAPMNAKTSNSNLPYLSAIGEPLLAGALGFSPLDFAGNQLSKNFLKKSFTPNLNNIGTESFTPRFKGARTDAIDFIGREEVGSPTFGGYGYPTQVSGAGMNFFPNTPNKFLNGEYSSFGNMQKGVVNNNIQNTQNNIYDKMNVPPIANNPISNSFYAKDRPYSADGLYTPLSENESKLMSNIASNPQLGGNPMLNKSWWKNSNWKEFGQEMRGQIENGIYMMDHTNKSDVEYFRKSMLDNMNNQTRLKLRDEYYPYNAMTPLQVNKLGGTTKKLKKYKC